MKKLTQALRGNFVSISYIFNQPYFTDHKAHIKILFWREIMTPICIKLNFPNSRPHNLPKGVPIEFKNPHIFDCTFSDIFWQKPISPQNTSGTISFRMTLKISLPDSSMMPLHVSCASAGRKSQSSFKAASNAAYNHEYGGNWFIFIMKRKFRGVHFYYLIRHKLYISWTATLSIFMAAPRTKGWGSGGSFIEIAIVTRRC